jgi:hypothetical protein
MRYLRHPIRWSIATVVAAVIGAIGYVGFDGLDTIYGRPDLSWAPQSHVTDELERAAADAVEAVLRQAEKGSGAS